MPKVKNKHVFCLIFIFNFINKFKKLRFLINNNTVVFSCGKGVREKLSSMIAYNNKKKALDKYLDYLVLYYKL